MKRVCECLLLLPVVTRVAVCEVTAVNRGVVGRFVVARTTERD